jgi:hypothetical protein
VAKYFTKLVKAGLLEKYIDGGRGGFTFFKLTDKYRDIFGSIVKSFFVENFEEEPYP